LVLVVQGNHQGQIMVAMATLLLSHLLPQMVVEVVKGMLQLAEGQHHQEVLVVEEAHKMALVVQEP
jgi:hypothetical protein